MWKHLQTVGVVQQDICGHIYVPVSHAHKMSIYAHRATWYFSPTNGQTAYGAIYAEHTRFMQHGSVHRTACSHIPHAVKLQNIMCFENFLPIHREVTLILFIIMLFSSTHSVHALKLNKIQLLSIFYKCHKVYGSEEGRCGTSNWIPAMRACLVARKWAAAEVRKWGSIIAHFPIYPNTRKGK